MDTSEFRTQDGYVYNGETYEDANALIQCGFLKFCGCGAPEENLRYIRDGLQHIKDAEENRPAKREEHGEWFKEWREKGVSLLGNRASRDFFFYWCDKEELTEHGGSIPGWLTDKGNKLLILLNSSIMSD